MNLPETKAFLRPINGLCIFCVFRSATADAEQAPKTKQMSSEHGGSPVQKNLIENSKRSVYVLKVVASNSIFNGATSIALFGK